MPNNRVFFSQDAVDRWLEQGHVALEGEVLSLLPAGPAFQLTSAVLFRAEVASGDDAPGLCGKIKTLSALRGMAGEHVPGSVLLGDHAYEVVDGFLGELLLSDLPAKRADSTLAALADLAQRG